MKKQHTVTATVRDIVLSYPTLYDVEKQDVILSSCLMKFGAGYEWQKGQLVCCYKSGSVVKARKHFQEKIADSSTMRDLQLKYMRQARDFEFVTEHIDELVTERSWRGFSPVHEVAFSEYSPIMQLPDDIQKDWLLAAFDVANNVVFHGDAYQESLKKEWLAQKPALLVRIDELMVKNGFPNAEQRRKNMASVAEIFGKLLKPAVA